MTKYKSYILIIIGVIITIYPFILERYIVTKETNKIENTLAKQYGYSKINNNDTYDAILSIPQISLKKGIYNKEDERNNIDKNIAIHSLSDYPDHENSNLILMAHSGSGVKAYFKDVHKLNNDSLIEYFYKNTKYVYKINNYYTIEKNGSAKIKRHPTKKTITLITCSQTDKTKQLIYIGYLIDEIKY